MDATSTEQILNHILDGYHGLSPKLRQAAQYVLDNPNEVGVSSMRQIAAAADVKPNTLVRMAKALGFEGYDAFRKPFRELLRKGVDSFPDRARWLQSIAQGKQHGQLLSQMAASSLANVEHMFSGASPDDLKDVAEMIVRARTTYVLGVGSCYSLAHSFYYVARMAIDNLLLVPRHGSLPIDDVSRIGDTDVLLAMSFLPYRREVAEATRVAKGRGAKVVTITDSRTSPLAFGVDYLFLVPTSTPQFFPSVVSTIALLETLIAFMVASSDRAVVKNIDDFHKARYQAGAYWTEDTD